MCYYHFLSPSFVSVLWLKVPSFGEPQIRFANWRKQHICCKDSGGTEGVPTEAKENACKAAAFPCSTPFCQGLFWTQSPGNCQQLCQCGSTSVTRKRHRAPQRGVGKGKGVGESGGDVQFLFHITCPCCEFCQRVDSYDDDDDVSLPSGKSCSSSWTTPP